MIKTTNTTIHISHEEVRKLIMAHLNTKGEQFSIDDIEIDIAGYLITINASIKRI